MDQHAYTVNLVWKKDRIGEVSSPELDEIILPLCTLEKPNLKTTCLMLNF